MNQVQKHTARTLHTQLTVSEKVRRALLRKTRMAATNKFHLGQKVWWYNDSVKKSRRGWHGMATVIGTDKGFIRIRCGQRVLQ